MKSVFSLLACCLLLTFSAKGEAACNLNNDKDFLYSHLADSAQPMLKFYYTTLCRPDSVELKEITLPPESSVEEQALYYFGLNHLSRYEDDPIPPIPDMISLGRLANVDWIVAEAKLNLAITYIDSDLLLTGEKLLHQVVPMARELGYSRLLARAYRWLGNIKSQQSDISASLQYYKMAYEIVEEIGDNFQITMTLNNIATIYMLLEDWQQAQNYIQQALELYRNNQYDNSLFEAILYGNSSAVYFANEEYQSSNHYLQLAIDAAEKTGSVNIRLITLADLARHHAKADNSDKALEIAQRCATLAEQQSTSRLTLAICEEALAVAHMSKQNYPQAIHYANKVIEALNESEGEEIVWEAEVLSILARAYEQLGDYQQSLHQLKKQMLLRQKYYDQFHNEEMLNERNSLERKLNLREIELLEATNELQQTRLQQQRWQTALFAFLFLTIGYFSLAAIIRLRRNNLKLHTLNTTDVLTGIHSRRHLEHWLKKLDTTQSGSQYLLCVIDIDHFKQFNDQHGHEVGDVVLKQTALTLKQSIRSQDVLVRWGGEEFIAIIPLHPTQKPQHTLERLRCKVERQTVRHHNRSFNVTISLGACCCSKSSLLHRWEAVFSHADSALYQAKQAGRNRYQLIDDANLVTPRDNNQ